MGEEDENCGSKLVACYYQPHEKVYSHDPAKEQVDQLALDITS